MLLAKILAFIRRDFAIEISYRFLFILRLLRVFAAITIFYFISKLFGKGNHVYLKEYGLDYFSFVLIGIAFYEYLATALRSFSDTIRNEQMSGTLEAMLSTPTDVSVLMVGSAIWDFIFNSITVVLYLAFGVIFLGADLSRMNLVAALIILALTVISFSGIGIISASFTVILKRGDPLSWLVSLCISLMGGVYYPVDIMPPFLRAFSYFLPITYSLRSLRFAILKGYGLTVLLPDIGILLGFCLFLIPLSLWLFRLALKKAKRDGSLVYY